MKKEDENLGDIMPKEHRCKRELVYLVNKETGGCLRESYIAGSLFLKDLSIGGESAVAFQLRDQNNGEEYIEVPRIPNRDILLLVDFLSSTQYKILEIFARRLEPTQKPKAGLCKSIKEWLAELFSSGRVA